MWPSDVIIDASNACDDPNFRKNVEKAGKLQNTLQLITDRYLCGGYQATLWYYAERTQLLKSNYQWDCAKMLGKWLQKSDHNVMI